MISGNINLNLINVTPDGQTGEAQNTSFNNLFNELLKILFENKDLSLDNNLMILPIQFLPFLPYGSNEQNLTHIMELLKQDVSSMDSFLELIQPNGNSSEISELIDKISENIGKNFVFENTNNEDLIVKLKTPINNNNNSVIDKTISQLTDEKTLNSQLEIGLTKEIAEKSLLDSKTLGVEKVLSFANEELITSISNNSERKTQQVEQNSTQLNISNIITTNGNNEAKIELPITRLHTISDVIFKAISSSQKTLTVQLEPPELGRILIKLFLDNGAIKADMKVDYPHVKDMIAGLIPEIRSNLQQSGVKVSDFLLDLTRDQKGYSDSYNNQGQKRYKGNQKFFEYFA